MASDKTLRFKKTNCTKKYTSGVPQNVVVVVNDEMPSLHSPKSVSLMWPYFKI